MKTKNDRRNGESVKKVDDYFRKMAYDGTYAHREVKSHPSFLVILILTFYISNFLNYLVEMY